MGRHAAAYSRGKRWWCMAMVGLAQKPNVTSRSLAGRVRLYRKRKISFAVPKMILRSSRAYPMPPLHVPSAGHPAMPSSTRTALVPTPEISGPLGARGVLHDEL